MRRRRERKVPRTATSVACPEICYGIMSRNSDRNIVLVPEQSASVTYFTTALTADCHVFVIIRFKCKSANLPGCNRALALWAICTRRRGVSSTCKSGIFSADLENTLFSSL